MISIDVAKDFTRFPSGRYRKNGSTSGEEFRARFLEDPIRTGKAISVNLDGTIGYGSSFLEEAFGGLVRSLSLDAHTILERLKLHSSDASLVDEIIAYIRDADRARVRS